MAMEYNPLDNSFVVYESAPNPKVELDLPLFDSPLDISDWSSGISRTGKIIAKDSRPTATRSPYTPISSEYIAEGKISQNISEKQKKAMEFFVNKGMSSIHAAGIVGNLMQESSLNEKATNPKSGAYGIAQWLGNRKSKLISKYGKNPTYDQQLNFLWEELIGDEKDAYSKLLSTRTVAEAVNSFMKNFERPSSREMAESISHRIKNANLLYDKNLG